MDPPWNKKIAPNMDFLPFFDWIHFAWAIIGRVETLGEICRLLKARWGFPPYSFVILCSVLRRGDPENCPLQGLPREWCVLCLRGSIHEQCLGVRPPTHPCERVWGFCRYGDRCLFKVCSVLCQLRKCHIIVFTGYAKYLVFTLPERHSTYVLWSGQSKQLPWPRHARERHCFWDFPTTWLHHWQWRGDQVFATPRFPFLP